MGRLGKSDHSILLAEVIAVEKKIEMQGNKLVWGRADWDKMRTLLKQIKWQEILARGSVNSAWENLVKEVDEITKICVPTARIKKFQQTKMVKRRSFEK